MELCFAPLWILKKRKKQAPSGFAVGGEIILVSKCYCLYDSGSQFTSFTTEREWESLRGDAGECCSRSGLHGAHSANIRMTPVFGIWVKDDNVQLGLCCSDSYFFYLKHHGLSKSCLFTDPRLRSTTGEIEHD